MDVFQNLRHSQIFYQNKQHHWRMKLILALYMPILLHFQLAVAVNRPECITLTEAVLEEILGPAFNGRYMSIEKPQKHDQPAKENNKKRASIESRAAFAVDDTYMEQLNDRPAWEVRNHAAIESNSIGSDRSKRDTNSYLQEWHCDSEIVWIDLGPDYFPRYLRSIECTSENCWFHIYNCRPRSFTIKLLKRKKNRCVQSNAKMKIGSVDFPSFSAELWVWEERALTFCCDCKL